MELHTVDTSRVRLATGSGSSPAPSAPIGFGRERGSHLSVELSPAPISGATMRTSTVCRGIGWLPNCFTYAARFGGPQIFWGDSAPRL